jgi:antitoxin component YwqK of YwqJK toxin-antitoxin module
MTSSIGYKKCANNRIVVLEPLGRNNEGRNDIVDANFAKMRCEFARVIKIYDANTKEEFDSATSFCDDYHKITYEKGKIVYPDKYDSGINIVCGSGIHYFKTEEPAFMCYVDIETINPSDSKFTLLYKHWYDNGLCMVLCNFKNGILDGESTFWHDNGIIELQNHYSNGTRNGECKVWHTNGKLAYIGNYINGELNSKQEWTSDGIPIVNNKVYQYGPNVDTNMKSPLSTYGSNAMQMSYTRYPVYYYPMYPVYSVYYY